MDGILDYIRRVLALNNVVKLEVTPDSVVTWRTVDEGEAVVPPELQEEAVFDTNALLESIELVALEFDPAENPYITLVRASQQVSSLRLVPSHILVQDIELFSAWLGFDHNVEKVLGVDVVLYKNEKYGPGRIVLTGTAGGALLSNVVRGVVIDMGV